MTPLEKKYRILVINPGATSTKISLFQNEEEIFKTNILHDAASLAPFRRVTDQKEYRLNLLLKALSDNNITIDSLDAICSRGGLVKHVPSGTYVINKAALKDVQDPPYGEHASNLGIMLASEIAWKSGIPAFFVDPVSTDELLPVARYSGFAPMQRESFFHALNQKGMAREAAKLLGKPYEELNLIICHMGGGVSVAAHNKGRVIDMFNVKDDGSFSMDRGGSLPVNAVVNYCFSGKTKEEVKHILGYEAGVFSYLGTRDFREVEQMVIQGNSKAKEVFDALVYQHIKDIGSMAAVLKFQVDAIILTGGMANSKLLCDGISDYVQKLAPIMILPGESEMKSLALGALRVLEGTQEAVEYK